jgi:hypothetical protein
VYEGDAYRLVCVGDEETARLTAKRIVDAMNALREAAELD